MLFPSKRATSVRPIARIHFTHRKSTNFFFNQICSNKKYT